MTRLCSVSIKNIGRVYFYSIIDLQIVSMYVQEFDYFCIAIKM